eukprot:10480722-Heterocapsa_arctica.AAC.1
MQAGKMDALAGPRAEARRTSTASYSRAMRTQRASWLCQPAKRNSWPYQRPRVRDSTWCTSWARSGSTSR